jgi:UDP-N-acetylmuramoylalanine--D-glutamate ligase
MSWQGKHVAVVGAGRSGLDAARALLALGAHVTLYDRNPHLTVEAAGWRLITGRDIPDWEGLELVVVSPALPPHHPLFEEARARHIPVWSEIELGYRLAQAPIIAVTGTNAKSTTAAFIHHLLTRAGKSAFLCGNIAGTAHDQTLTAAALVAQRSDWLVAEVSSFQLQNVHQFRPHIAIITTITPDHLDYHGSFEAYARAKGRLLHNLQSTDWAILNGADAGIQQLLGWLRAEQCHGLHEVERAGHLITELSVGEVDAALESLTPLASLMRLPLQIGVLVARLVGCGEAQIWEGVRTFRGIPHRMEWVGAAGGVAFINNSMCTNAAALEHALRVVSKPCMVIAGGVDKNGSIEAMAEAIQRYCRAALLIGRDGERILAALRERGYSAGQYVGTLERAVECAMQMAQPGDTVILAPGCASFDQFRNFIERGERFRALVKAIEASWGGQNETYKA